MSRVRSGQLTDGLAAPEVVLEEMLEVLRELLKMTPDVLGAVKDERPVVATLDRVVDDVLTTVVASAGSSDD